MIFGVPKIYLKKKDTMELAIILTLVFCGIVKYPYVFIIIFSIILILILLQNYFLKRNEK
jgi:hypothetical protein